MHPVKMMMESKLEVHKDKTLREATEMAYKVCCLVFFFLLVLSNIYSLGTQAQVQHVQKLL